MMAGKINQEVEFECQKCSRKFKKTLEELESDGLVECYCKRICRPISGTLNKDTMMALVINYLSHQTTYLVDKVSSLEDCVYKLENKVEELERANGKF